MKNLFLLFSLLCLSYFNAQTVTPEILSNNGGSAQTPGGGIDWTIGEPVTETYNTFTFVTTMGFHQTDLNLIAFVSENSSENGLLVYPNPVRDILNVSFKGMTEGHYTVRLCDAAGKIIILSGTDINSDNRELQLKLSDVAAGNYFLTVQNKSFTRTIKINKVY